MKSVCLLVGVCDPKELDDLARRSKEWEQPLPQSGAGNSVPKLSGARPFRFVFADSVDCATSGAVLADRDRDDASMIGSVGVGSGDFAASGGGAKPEPKAR